MSQRTNFALLRRLGAAVLILGGFIAENAVAATVSYTFTQGGWSDQAGDTGTLTGTFSAIPEANGAVQLANLASFDAKLKETGPLGPVVFTFTSPSITDFSYDPNSGLFTFAAGSAASGIQLCSGSTDTNAVCLGLASNPSVSSIFQGFFDDLPKFGETTTTEMATVTQTPATVPEPENLPLLAVGAGFFGAGVLRKRAGHEAE